MYIGAHVNSSGGVWKAIGNGADIGCEAIQIFAGSPRTWAPTLYKDGDAKRFREAREASAIRFVVIHTIYLINLASAREDFYEKSVTSLAGAVAAAEQLGADAIVTHVGSHQGAGFAAGLERVRAALLRALAESEGSDVRLLLENTAGAGTTFGGGIEELGSVLHGLDAAGVARAVHANDCLFGQGEHKDRHAWIGEGTIGEAGFAAMLAQERLTGVPALLEMPGEMPVKDVENIDRLKRLRGDAPA